MPFRIIPDLAFGFAGIPILCSIIFLLLFSPSLAGHSYARGAAGSGQAVFGVRYGNALSPLGILLRATQ
jgi:hypothetical protein